MAGPTGALAAAYKLTRALQVASLLAIIGMTANFVSEIVNADATPPRVVVGVLSIVCIAVLYCVITVILFLDNILPHLVSTGIDGLFLIALVVVAVIIGRPVSYLNCHDLSHSLGVSSSATAFTSALASGISTTGGPINFTDFIGTSKATCYEVKSIWGLSIALCILFTFSGICSLCLWRRSKTVAGVKGEA